LCHTRWAINISADVMKVKVKHGCEYDHISSQKFLKSSQKRQSFHPFNPSFGDREHNQPAAFSIMQLHLISPCSVGRMELSHLLNPDAFCEVAARLERAVKPVGVT
jgi:hypothetical protein